MHDVPHLPLMIRSHMLHGRTSGLNSSPVVVAE